MPRERGVGIVPLEGSNYRSEGCSVPIGGLPLVDVDTVEHDLLPARFGAQSAPIPASVPKVRPMYGRF